MIKTRLVAIFMASLVLFYTGCSEKEVPQPVEDTKRIDELRAELRQLLILVHGEELANTLSKISNDSLKAKLEALKSQYNTLVSYQVVAQDFQGNVIPSATVTINQNGVIVSKQTAADGSATFTGVKSGYVVAVVSASGYATANFTTSLFESDEGRANTRVPLLPTSADALSKNGTVTYKGYLYANFNVANDTAGTYNSVQNASIDSKKGSDPATKDPGPNSSYPHRTYDKVNKTLYATPYIRLADIPTVTTDNYYPEAGTIRSIAYENAIYNVTFDSNNKYTLVLPIMTLDALEYEGGYLQFALEAYDFSADQTRVSVGTTSSDGAPLTVDNPTPKTFVQTRIFRYPGSYVYNWFEIPTVIEGKNLFYSEGTID